MRGTGAAAAAEDDVVETDGEEEAVGGGEGGRRRRRNLSDVSIRSPRKGRTHPGKKTRLFEDSDGVEIVNID